MTILVAGIDFSSQQIDAALIPYDPDHGDASLADVTWRRELIPQLAGGHMRPAHALYLTLKLLAPVADTEVTHVWVERPWTRSWVAAAALFPVYGAILAASWQPRGRRHVNELAVGEWRQQLGLRTRGKDRKADSVRKALELMGGGVILAGDVPATALTEHMAEAYLIAHVGRQIMHKAERDGRRVA